MECLRCHHANSSQARFCENCGTALAPTCIGCGAALAADAGTCARCGAAAPGAMPAAASAPAGTGPALAAGDRRQATVLFVDISGYSALCSRSDPEQIHDMLAAFFDAMDRVVERYGGRVFDRIGDAVMAVFGAPVAHGNDATRAIRAALDMHVAAAGLRGCDGRPVRVHIGIASGEVVASAIVGSGSSKYSVTGDPVNLAARLDTQAAAGETLISQALYDAVATIADAEALGPFVVKGLPDPVWAWRLRGLSGAPTERAPFVGRDAELARIVAALDATRSTGSGMTIVVRGDAGIGKSRLVDECRIRAQRAGFDTFAGQVLDFGVGKGEDAVSSVLKAALGIARPDDDRAARRSAVDRAMAAGLVAPDDEVFVNELLDLEQPPALKAMYGAIDNAARVRGASTTVAKVLQRSAALRSNLVILEDIHWASPDLVGALPALARAAATSPMLLILTSRIEGDPLDRAWHAAIDGAPSETLDLRPLRPIDAHALARHMVDDASRFALQCIERAEGNPLFLEQLLRTRRESESAEVPPTIQSLVRERMDRLREGDRRVLQVASVIGKRFSVDGLRALTGRDDVSCDRLVAADLFRPAGSGAYLFAHALIQEAVYSSTLKSTRRELHRAAADWFGDAEPVLRAEHLDRADDPRAAAAYLVAATREAERYRYDAAARLAERGSALAMRQPNDITAAGCRLALLQGDVLLETGRSNESIVAFQAALRSARDDDQRCHAWMGIAAANRVTGEFDVAMDALDQAEPIAKALGLANECSRIHHTRGNLYFAQGQVNACEEEHRAALEHATRGGDAACEARALSGLGDAEYAQSRMHTALTFFRRCVALCAGRAWIRIEGPNRCMVGHCLWYENRLAAGIAEVERALADGRALGVVPLQVFALASLTQLLTEAGRTGEAERACIDGLAVARQAGSRRYESLLDLFYAEIRLQQRDRVRAMAHARKALEVAHQIGLGFAGAPAYARLARTIDDPQERAEALARGEALLEQPALSHCHLWFYRDAIEAAIDAGDWPRAMRYADALERFVQAEPLPWARSLVARARALCAVAREPGPGAAARLLRVRDHLARKGIGWTLAAIDTAPSAVGAVASRR